MTSRPLAGARPCLIYIYIYSESCLESKKGAKLLQVNKTAKANHTNSMWHVCTKLFLFHPIS